MNDPLLNALTNLEAHTLFLTCQINALFRALPPEISNEALVFLEEEVATLRHVFVKQGRDEALISAIDFHHQHWAFSQEG
jgi:hypothetical protein